MMHFVEIAVVKRGTADVPICLILDAAPQHAFDDMDEMLSMNNIHIVTVPPGLTHAFQPADQFIKAKAHKAWSSYVEELFCHFDIETAIGKLHSSSMKIARSGVFFAARRPTPVGDLFAVRRPALVGVFLQPVGRPPWGICGP